MLVAELVGLIGRGNGAKFANLTYRTEKTKELSRYSLILGASTEVLYTKDIEILEDMVTRLDGIKLEAAQAILASRRQSLEKGIGSNDAYTNADTYVHVDGIPGVRIHKETGILYVAALSQGKTVIEEGEPQKPVNSRPLTIAKKEIEKTLPSARFRLFKLTIQNIRRAALNGEVLEIEA